MKAPTPTATLNGLPSSVLLFRSHGVVVMPNTEIAIIAGLALAVIAALLLWRSARKADTMGYLKNTTVSRQWLMEHQGEDRS